MRGNAYPRQMTIRDRTRLIDYSTQGIERQVSRLRSAVLPLITQTCTYISLKMHFVDDLLDLPPSVRKAAVAKFDHFKLVEKESADHEVRIHEFLVSGAQSR